jgi:hypothetical protein
MAAKRDASLLSSVAMRDIMAEDGDFFFIFGGIF